MSADHHTIFNHPSLGAIKGVQTSDAVSQFRGIPYATIPGRWEHSKLLPDLNEKKAAEEEVFDATNWGPMAPQMGNSVQIDFSLIQHTLPFKGREPAADEFNCLNLVVTRPHTEEGARLPVLFMIHGGGFFIGANSFPQYDTSRLVEWGVKIGRPFVSVSVNYRLGHLGFLASSELNGKDDAGNFGLRDQQTAMRWVKANIAGFGGDPDNVTCFGESAGGISTHCHLLQGEPLFNRAACLSGDTTLRPIKSLQMQERRYSEFLTRMGAKKPSLEERMAHIKSLPWENVVSDPANMRPFPTISGGFNDVPAAVAAQRAQSEGHFGWCKELLMSDCLYDGSLYMRPFIGQPWQQTLQEALDRYLTPEEGQLVKETWKINQRKDNNIPVDLGLLRFITDVRFYWPIARTLEAAAPDANIHVYHFHQKNKWDGGPGKGLATHELDLAMLLLNYNELMDDEGKKVAESLATHIIEFAYGNLPRERHSTDVFGGSEVKKTMSHEAYDKEVRGGAANVIRKIGFEKCVKVLELFQFGEEAA